MTGLAALSARMRKLSRQVEKNADELVRNVAKDVLRTVVTDTPVDTGQARSNWIVHINDASSEIIDAYVPGKKGSTGSANIREAIANGSSVIDTYKYGQTVHITNNLPYIRALNDGYSNQAPPGYVQDALLEASLRVKSEGVSITSNLSGSE